MTRRHLALLAALCGLAAAQTAPTAPSTQVVVRFGALHWIDARGGAPHIRDGRVVVPFAPACDLLGLTCRAEAGGVRVKEDVGGRLVPHREAGFVELRALLQGHGGFTLTYDPVAHMAVMDTRPNVNMVLTPWMRAHNDWGTQLRRPYQGPLFSLKRKAAQGARYQLSTAGAALGGVTLLRPLSATPPRSVPVLSVQGALTPSLPGTPNRDPGCGGRASCTETVDREGLWTLAAVDAG